MIKHLYLKGLAPEEIKAELDEVYGTPAPVFVTVCNWISQFKRGLTFTKDDHRSGRHLPSRQCTGAHPRSVDGQNYGIEI